MASPATDFPSRPPLPSSLTEALRRNWGWLLALGIFTILAGLLALSMPALASVAVTSVAGAAFLTLGALQIWHALQASSWRPRLWHLLSGFVTLFGGFLLVANPLAGVVGLTGVVIGVMIADGLVRLVMGLRAHPEAGWGWVAFGGALSLALGLYLALQFGWAPAADEAAAARRAFMTFSLLGLLAGVSLIMEGWGYVFLALAARRHGLQSPPSSPMIAPSAPRAPADQAAPAAAPVPSPTPASL